MINQKKNRKKGFTLMVALLVNAIIMVIGLGISSIILREFNLSVVSRESQSAFYAADTLTECMLYWDLKGGIFNNDPANLNDLVCDKVKDASGNYQDVTMNMTQLSKDTIIPCDEAASSGIDKYTYTYKATLNVESATTANKPSADADMTREQSCILGDPLSVFTTISSNGHNTSDVTNPKRIERGLQFKY